MLHNLSFLRMLRSRNLLSESQILKFPTVHVRNILKRGATLLILTGGVQVLWRFRDHDGGEEHDDGTCRQRNVKQQICVLCDLLHQEGANEEADCA